MSYTEALHIVTDYSIALSMGYECSECHETEWRTSDSRMKWCMFCGAKMDGGSDNGKMGRI